MSRIMKMEEIIGRVLILSKEAKDATEFKELADIFKELSKLYTKAHKLEEKINE